MQLQQIKKLLIASVGFSALLMSCYTPECNLEQRQIESNIPT